ncbi:E3 ubiquitin-protein ligase SH3RF1-like [Uranotaenia lowii]|uniref:E3 ubiquitin-protein ligase SH3RF1-like n=1 Tax=Uranotaenia lowii TaxID=190385 RepID=UPI0024792909|nr:E3 ubiquitin-protein ligase SH3RF1-like [Uranotaenia lowii]XP_055592429.1 E3 ubiquitin-protein ligase SH3RF1-like [Uranotaenia lowii]XP_055592430.1 E3 ubiquitin-protein ligase SH3RF1-like [Uranotaenia lowii]XP_055592431.1 E3 ubiquitin-protein ligase SH3RF1-like [Uranotaenia lowii]
MDERLLNDLLECSVCLERLDTSSKVLPCQHTFCRKCLEEIVASHQELRCPECRVLVDVKIDELPPNVLLMRILEGMKTAELNNQNTNINKAARTGVGGVGGGGVTGGIGGAANIFNLQHLHHHQNHPSIAFQGSSQLQQQHQLLLLQQQQHQQQQQQQQQQPPQLQHAKNHPHYQQQQQQHGGSGGVGGIQNPQQQQPQGQHATVGRIIATGGNNALDLSKIPHAKAFYDFASSETSDISFKKGDIVILKKKIDHNWCIGEVNGKEGAVPLNHLQVVIPLPYPQCKALFDFSMGPNDEEGCLTFKKGALIHVLRRVDQNWAEGRIGDKIGIFPISFVEMNFLGKQLMDSALKQLLANNSNNRTVPPTPFDLNGSDTTTSSSVTTSPNTSNSTTSSTSSTAPSSPTSQFLTAAAAATTATPASGPGSKDPKEKRHSLTSFLASSSGPSAAVGGSLLQPNRHSHEILSTPDSELQSQSQPAVNASSSNSSAAAASPAAANESQPPPPSAAGNFHGKSGKSASQLYHQHPHLPATYIALYPYKPQKPDELELKKGSIYYVTERCQDGWFKGANRQQKVGVFPGNYVTVYKGRNEHRNLLGASTQSATATSTTGTAVATAGVLPHQQQLQPPSLNNPSNITNNLANNQVTLPALPPRDTGATCSGGSKQQTANQSGNYIESLFGRKSGGEKNSGSVGTSGGTPTNGEPSATSSNKEKKDSSAVSLMKRLTNIKRSKSPTAKEGGTSNPAYSSDNPAFEDGLPTTVKPNLQQIINPVHVRSGSCPSQLLQNLPIDLHLAQGRENVPYMYGSQRVKPHKERPSMHGLKHESAGRSSSSKHSGGSQQQKSHEAPASATAACGGHSSSEATAPPKTTTQAYHRKSHSLDASAIISHMSGGGAGAATNSGGTPSSKSSSKSHAVRERFKCIVPYPPNSEYELELRIGDIVLVHKKRDNGWYKGTHQRTGKTGLFPASFVEPDL